jgi:EpsI family protein
MGSIGFACKGKIFTLKIMPLLAVIFLGYPHISVMMNTFTTTFFDLKTLHHSMWLRIPVSIGLFLWYYQLKKQHSMRTNVLLLEKSIDSKFLTYAIAFASLILSYQAYTFGVASKADDATEVEFSYFQNDWVGKDLILDSQLSDFFGKGHIWAREYWKAKHTIEVLINSSGGNREQNHPPEYCLTGSGWKIVATHRKELNIGSFGSIEVTQIQLKKGNRDKFFIYWFSDGRIMYPDFISMSIADMGRRLVGRRTDWFLFRMSCDSDISVMNEFIKSFQFIILNSR